MQNLVVVSHTVCAHIGGPKNLGDAEARPLRLAVADLLHVPAPWSFYVKPLGRR